ncbi:hypothetical protein LAZ67_3004673 [Cordylochernes scorpioides]|uniref:Uncharacterized protein n=1 Tax=Cordylochernes scorpioides TaxID=51811 RepID=A0ABY6K9X5_9ARAC|nr:hypothetical protein LAZ67_3004673 [Cordylochernes scorpioides]
MYPGQKSNDYPMKLSMQILSLVKSPERNKFRHRCGGNQERPRILATTEGEIVYQFNVKLLTCFNPNISSIFSHNHTGEKNYICSFFKI